jgi:lysophospholipase L1-like esterase
VAALFALAPVAAYGQSDTVTFTSGAGVSDLACPSGAVTTPPHQGPPRMQPETNVQIPTPGELGALATPVPHDPPVLDLAKIPEFALKDASGAPRPRRFAFWGDSHIAAGPFMAQLFDTIRAHGETVGTRFLPPTMGRANVRLPTLHAYCIGQGWSTALAFTAPQTLQTGPALATRNAAADQDSYLWLDFRDADRQATLRQVQLVYRPSGADTELTMSVNDGPEQVVALPGAATDASGPSSSGGDSAFLTIRADALISTIKLRVSRGDLALEGFILDHDQAPTVTLDVFGLPGSTARGWANTDPAFLAQALHGETYDGIVLEYGTNEGNDTKFDAGKYALGLTRTLSNMRSAFPHAACVLIGPPDRGILLARTRAVPADVDFLKYAHIHQQIAAAQAQAGAQFGCVAWDWQAYMGGPGGNYGWVYSDPVLMGRDLTHLTAAGYKRTGLALAQSLGWAEGLYP